MTDFPITTSLVSTDLAIGWQTALGLSVDMSPIDKSANIVRSWNGRAKNLAADEFKLFECSISSSGDMRPPALSNMWPGAVFTIVPPAELSDTIQAGATSRTLIRKPFSGSIRCLTLNFKDVPFEVIGSQTVRLLSPSNEVTRIFYRPELTLFVTEPWRISTNELKADVSWSLTAEEVGGD